MTDSGSQPQRLPISLAKLKIVCPNCGKKGIGWADHPHAFNWKDYGTVRCRFCHTRWKTEDFAAWYYGKSGKEGEQKAEGDKT